MSKAKSIILFQTFVCKTAEHLLPLSSNNQSNLPNNYSPSPNMYTGFVEKENIPSGWNLPCIEYTRYIHNNYVFCQN
jgi:hypothetical protein